MPGDKVLEVIPVIATGLFAGAALGITVGEQPARELLDAQHAKEHFLESYQRIAVSQVSFAAIGSASSAWLAYKEAGPTRKLNAASAILLASVIPFTALVIKPTNDILRSKEQVSDAEVKKGLKTWSKLHLVRTVASIASFGLATLSLAASHKADPQPVSY